MNDCIAAVLTQSCNSCADLSLRLSAELPLEPGAEAGHPGVDGRYPRLPTSVMTEAGHSDEDADPGLAIGDEAAPRVALASIPTSTLQTCAQVRRQNLKKSFVIESVFD